MPVGAIICFLTFGRLGKSLGWRVPMFIPMMIGVVGLVAFLLLYKSPPNQPQKITQEKQGAGVFSSLLKLRGSIWLVGFCWMWFNAASISFSTFAPDFLVSKGYSVQSAGFLASLLMWGSLVLSPIIGRLIDKVNNNELFIGAGGVILAAAIYLVTRSTYFVVPMAIMAVGVSLIPAPVFSFPSKILEPENLGLSFGILFTLGNTGIFLGPYIAGLVKDETGSYEGSFIFLSILAVLITVTALILRIKLRKG